MLENDKKANFMTFPEVIIELVKIEMIKQMSDVYWLDHAVTAKQKAILKAFCIKDFIYIKKQALKISEELAKLQENNSG